MWERALAGHGMERSNFRKAHVIRKASMMAQCSGVRQGRVLRNARPLHSRAADLQVRELVGPPSARGTVPHMSLGWHRWSSTSIIFEACCRPSAADGAHGQHVF